MCTAHDNPDLDNYDDDYLANACVPVRGSSPSSDPARIPAPRAASRAPAARAVPARAASHATGRVNQLRERDRRPDHSRGRSNPQPANHPNPTTNPRTPCSAVANTPGDQPNPLPASHSTSCTYDLPPNTTKQQNCKADKKTATKEALADASRARTSAQAPVAPCPNQKQHALSEPTVASDKESDEEPVARNSTRKIKPMAREHAKAKPPVQETKGKTGKATKPNKAPTKAPAKTPAKTPPKVSAKPQARSTNVLGKRKADQAKDDQDLTANKQSKATGNVDTPKRKAVEDDEIGHGATPQKKQAYPRMRPAPSEPGPEPESPNPPASPILSAEPPLNDNNQASQDNVPAPGPSCAAIDGTLAGEQLCKKSRGL
ncbi:hypothetical protein RhiLY_05777 [Ceratobasidium sp. AG-Ba]|nr:hypothetical protein RhiLY_05777 [Ceratobasidium sp. AG-Ba]